MEKIFIVFRHMQQENQPFYEFLVHLQSIQTLTSLGCVHTTPLMQKNHKLIDGIHSKFRGFFNQVCLFIWLLSHCYPSGLAQVNLINTLLLGTILMWFMPLLKHQSPLLNNFEAFNETFSATFGDLDKEHTSTNKL
jgi:hypothetical protein